MAMVSVNDSSIYGRTRGPSRFGLRVAVNTDFIMMTAREHRSQCK